MVEDTLRSLFEMHLVLLREFVSLYVRVGRGSNTRTKKGLGS